MVEAEKVEPLSAHGEVHDPGLLRMQSQPDRIQHRRHQLAGLFGLLTGGAQDDEIICVLHQRSQPLPARLPRLIENMKGDVGEQR